MAAVPASIGGGHVDNAFLPGMGPDDYGAAGGAINGCAGGEISNNKIDENRRRIEWRK